MTASATNPVKPAPDKGKIDKDGADALYPAVKHTVIEDIYAFAIGCSFVVLGIIFLKSAGLVTGGVAGIALLVSYVVPLPVGVLFMLINIPFFLFAWPAMGKRFMIKTVIVNLAIMGLASLAPLMFTLSNVNPLFAALFGGTIIGMGILALARHSAGAGGTGVLALYLQKTKGINAGKTQMLCDALILSASILVLNWQQVGLSLLSAAAMSGVMLGFHRPERYIGR
ncbi:membrane protein [Asticcacaulis sp. AC460]|uniref:YitT family protein n=1 Tax=Asticcacaulis sp. AC460 TaxID=1282360 RepID=UPI0003C3B2C9|nr:YitT family protein [Asticcacaulis sp. AC460]ESQ90345.1 membrane protein [Asticcacaulis sp. AC460]